MKKPQLQIHADGCISTPRQRLTLRHAVHAPFMRQLWANRAFMGDFHPAAPPLPEDEARLCQVLDAERQRAHRQPKALHWVIEATDGTPWGLLSLTDISWQHRRAEVLIGVLPGAPFGMATAAMLMLFGFYFEHLRMHKLYSLVFEHNQHSLRGTLHLGFVQEALLREHVRDPATGQFRNLIQTGLLRDAALSDANRALMRRLLG